MPAGKVVDRKGHPLPDQAQGQDGGLLPASWYPKGRMKRRDATFLLGNAALAWPLLIRAQQLAKIPRIGFLAAVPLATLAPRTQAFRRGLRELGYIEGENVVIEWRSADGREDRFPALAAELMRLRVDVIVTAGSSATRAAKEASVTTPIVMMQDGDPVASGFVASLARPGGNITGLSTLFVELYGKQLELLKEAFPRLARIAVLGSSTEPSNARAFRSMEPVARALGVQLQYLDVRSPDDIETAFRAAKIGRADAILLMSSSVLAAHQTQLIDQGVRSGLPVIVYNRSLVEAGLLMSFSTNSTDLARRAATYVDKILKGMKPAELPVEQPTKFELVINLKTAKALGLTIPPTLLARADEVIE